MRFIRLQELTESQKQVWIVVALVEHVLQGHPRIFHPVRFLGRVLGESQRVDSATVPIEVVEPLEEGHRAVRHPETEEQIGESDANLDHRRVLTKGPVVGIEGLPKAFFALEQPGLEKCDQPGGQSIILRVALPLLGAQRSRHGHQDDQYDCGCLCKTSSHTKFFCSIRPIQAFFSAGSSHIHGRVYLGCPTEQATDCGGPEPPSRRLTGIWVLHLRAMTDVTASDPLFSDLSFSDIDIPEELLAAVNDLGFERLTRVQEEVLPLSLEGRDIVAQAQTGSGKTAAYLLTLLSRMIRQERRSEIQNPRGLIIAPTRELAVQIASDAEKLSTHTPFSVHVVFGGIDYKKQQNRFADGVDLLIGTPGRLIDYHRKGAYSLHDTEMVVVDECDRLFDMGFAEDLRWLLHRLPYTDKRQSLMFTATLSRRVMQLGWREMTNPAEIIINREQLTPDTVHQELYHVASHEKLSLLLGPAQTRGRGTNHDLSQHQTRRPPSR